MTHFNHIKLDKLNFDLESETKTEGRLYILPDGSKVPSVTTVLSKIKKDKLDKWIAWVGVDKAQKIAQQAAIRGTKLHDVCEQYLLNNMSEMKLRMLMPDTKSLFRQFKTYFDNDINNILCLEQALYSYKLGLAGRVDCVAEWKNELAIIDFKTSTKEKLENDIKNYFMQCTIYSLMFEELTGIIINNIIVLIAVETDNKSQIFIKDRRNYLEDTLKFIQENT